MPVKVKSTAKREPLQKRKQKSGRIPEDMNKYKYEK